MINTWTYAPNLADRRGEASGHSIPYQSAKLLKINHLECLPSLRFMFF